MANTAYPFVISSPLRLLGGSFEMIGTAGAEQADWNLNSMKNFKIEALSTEPVVTAGRLILNTAFSTPKFGYGDGTKYIYPDMEKSVYDTNNNGNVDKADNAFLLEGHNGAWYLDLSNSSGQLPIGALVDHDSMHYDIPLNQFAVPTGPISLNGFKVTNVAECTNDTDVANKKYVDTKAQGLKVRDSVVAATVGNITLSGTQTIDGVAVTVGQRVLVKAQTAASANGIYICASGSWSRATDTDTWEEIYGSLVYVSGGTSMGYTTWACNCAATGTMGTDNIPWGQFSGAAEINAGTGLTKTGNTINTGAGTGITVGADDVSITSEYRVKRFAATITGDGTWTSKTITHGLNTLDVDVKCYNYTGSGDARIAIGAQFMCNVVATDANNITLNFATAPLSSYIYRVVVFAVGA